jgi:imidazolonepropionase-like amidohydrolase
MGLAAQLRQAFIDAEDYKAKLVDYERKKSEAIQSKKPEPLAPKRDLKLEALLPYLDGKKTIVLAAESPSDLETAVGLANEFKLKFVLNHIAHSQPVLDYVASLKVPVIVGPIYEMPKEDERYDAVYSLPAQLNKRGVKIVFASYSAHNVRNLPDQAGFATAFGLPYDEALKAITLNAAEVWGVADQLGSLDVGKTANVVVSNGDPLDVKTDVKQVFIQGRAIPMTNRQTRLRDEYSK